MEGMQDADDVTEWFDAVDDPLQVAQVGAFKLVLFQGDSAVLELEIDELREDFVWLAWHGVRVIAGIPTFGNPWSYRFQGAPRQRD